MKKGFTLIELLAVIVILAVIALIATPIIGSIIANVKNNSYFSNEDALKKAAINYAAVNNSILPINAGDRSIISLNVLKKENYILSIKNPATKQDCDGNVVIQNIGSGKYKYIPYLSCSADYETEEYITSDLVANYKLNGNANDSTKLSSNGTINGAVPAIYRKSQNLLLNGNFLSDIDNNGIADMWEVSSYSTTNVSLSNGVQSFTRGTNFGPLIGYIYNNTVGHIYYYAIDVKTDSNLVRLDNGLTIADHSGSGNFETLSWRTAATNATVPHRYLYDNRSSGFSPIQAKNARYYDLTAMFGSGKEPSKNWCDANLNSSNDYQAYNFDGVDDYIELTDSANLRMTTGGTIEAWIYPRTIGENSAGRILDKSIDVNGTNGYLLCVYSNNIIYFKTSSDGATTSNNNSITLNSWNHIVVTFNSSGRKIYVNGVDVTASGSTLTSLPPDTAGTVYIGNRSNNDRTFDGYIDDVHLYNKVLSATEIMNNYIVEK